MSTNQTMTGNVKWFDDSRGFGFIEPDPDFRQAVVAFGNPDAFVHVSVLEAAGLGSLDDGDVVKFVFGELPTGRMGCAEILSINREKLDKMDDATVEQSRTVSRERSTRRLDAVDTEDGPIVGTVVRFCPEQGTGHIQVEGYRDVHFDVAAATADVEQLAVGSTVSFVVVAGRKRGFVTAVITRLYQAKDLAKAA